MNKDVNNFKSTLQSSKSGILQLKATAHYLSAPATSATTLFICKMISADWWKFTNILLVLPTTEEIEETSVFLDELHVRHSAIFSKSSQDEVRSQTVRALKDAPDTGMVLLITWETYARLAFFPGKDFWKIVVLGAPCAQETYNIGTHDSGPVIDHVTSHPSDVEGAISLRASNVSRLRKAIRDGSAGANEGLFWALSRGTHTVLVHDFAWEHLTGPAEPDGSKMNLNIVFTCMLQSRLFQDSLIVGENFEKSLLYRWLLRGDRFRLLEDQELKSSWSRFTGCTA